MPQHDLRRAAGPILLVLLPILVKLPLIAGLLHADPLLLHGGLQHGLVGGPLGPGLPSIDPNVGFTSHALGTRAALDLLAGHIPWWNPFEGVGTPLAGEMQSAALFPLTLLLGLRNGQVYEHIAFQIIAGLATYGLLRRLDVARLPAFAGAAVFAFNGVFAWLANAVANPVPFLPVLLLGIEVAANRARQARPGGLWLIAIAVAASLNAGFPEVAYLNGLLAAVWTMTRAASLDRRASLIFLARTGLAAVAGLLIAAPIVIAFADYLPLAEIGAHVEGGFQFAHLDKSYLVTMALPYWGGGIFSRGSDGGFWGSVGGYAGVTLLALAGAGLAGAASAAFSGLPRQHVGLRLVLAAWIIVTVSMTFGLPWFDWLFHAVPFLSQVAVFRYFPASWIMALCVLAALGLDDVLRGGPRWPLVVGVLLLALGVAGLLHVAPLDRSLTRLARAARVLGLLWAALLLGLSLWPGLSIRRRTTGLAAIMVAEAIIWFAIPIASYPRHGSVEREGIQFLQTNLGLQRIMSLGPISPNYGSYFGIAAINHNDLPIPRAWVAYVRAHLDANYDAIAFNGDVRADPAGPSARDMLAHNLAAYAAIGVRYVVTPIDRPLPDLPEVFRDRVMRIYELTDVAAYASAPGCELDMTSRTEMTARCDAAASLVRLEMAMPGWRAWVDDQPADIATTGEIFQSVALPAGTSRVQFAFRPPFMAFGYAAFAAGWLLLLAAQLWAMRQKPQPTERSLPRTRLR